MVGADATSLRKLLNALLTVSVATVFKFAGDATIVLWPPSGDSLQEVARRAAQCALEIQRHLHGLKLHDRKKLLEFELSLKIGIGVGRVTISNVGGVDNRMESIATGAPLLQAFRCEAQAEPGEVFVSRETLELIKDFFNTKQSPDDVNAPALLLECRKPLTMRNISSTMQLESLLTSDAAFLGRALALFMFVLRSNVM